MELRLARLEKEVAKLTADADSATAQRKKENEDYKAAHQDLSESVDAIEMLPNLFLALTQCCFSGGHESISKAT